MKPQKFPKEMEQRMVEWKGLILLFTIILITNKVSSTALLPYNQVGANWTYSSAGCPTNYKMSVLSEVETNLYKVQTGCDGLSSTYNYYNYATDWVELPYFISSNINYTLTPPQIILPYNLSVGQTWTQTISESSAYEVINYDYTSTITNVEEISVPAGTFSCYVVVTDKTSSSYTTWWEETIGIIQIEYSPKLELLSYYLPSPTTPSPFPSFFPSSTYNSYSPSASASGYYHHYYYDTDSPVPSTTPSITPSIFSYTPSTSNTPITPSNTPSITYYFVESASATASMYASNYYYYYEASMSPSVSNNYYDNEYNSSDGLGLGFWIFVIGVLLFSIIVAIIIGGYLVKKKMIKDRMTNGYSPVETLGNNNYSLNNTTLNPHNN